MLRPGAGPRARRLPLLAGLLGLACLTGSGLPTPTAVAQANAIGAGQPSVGSVDQAIEPSAGAEAATPATSRSPSDAGTRSLDPDGSAQVAVSVDTTYFEVVGTTGAALAQQLRTHAAGQAADGWIGSTSWRFSWGYDHLTDASGCRSQRVAVQLHLQVVVPHWAAEAASDPELLARWSAFAAALDVHERGHERIAIDAAHALAEALSDLPPAPTCADLDGQARAVLDGTLHAHEQAQADYDRRSQHGVTQGAVFT